jgi:hypothetical protein
MFLSSSMKKMPTSTSGDAVFVGIKQKNAERQSQGLRPIRYNNLMETDVLSSPAPLSESRVKPVKFVAGNESDDEQFLVRNVDTGMLMSTVDLPSVISHEMFKCADLGRCPSPLDAGSGGEEDDDDKTVDLSNNKSKPQRAAPSYFSKMSWIPSWSSSRTASKVSPTSVASDHEGDTADNFVRVPKGCS